MMNYPEMRYELFFYLRSTFAGYVYWSLRWYFQTSTAMPWWVWWQVAIQSRTWTTSASPVHSQYNYLRKLESHCHIVHENVWYHSVRYRGVRYTNIFRVRMWVDHLSMQSWVLLPWIEACIGLGMTLRPPNTRRTVANVFGYGCQSRFW